MFVWVFFSVSSSPTVGDRAGGRAGVIASVRAAEVAVLAGRSGQLDIVPAAGCLALDIEGRSTDADGCYIIAELDFPDADESVVVIATVEAGREDRLVARDSSAARYG